jgi:hypothetical protein
VTIGGTEFEACFTRRDGMIHFTKAIEIDLGVFHCTTEHSDIPAYLYSFPTSQFALEISEHFNNIWQAYDKTPFPSLFDVMFIHSDFPCYLTNMHTFCTLSYRKYFHNLRNLMSNKQKTVHKGVLIAVEEGDNELNSKYACIVFPIEK